MVTRDIKIQADRIWDALSTSIDEELRRGLTRADGSRRPIVYRYLAPADDVDVVTTLLHDAYAPLAAAGMRFVASHQDSATTRARMASGETVVALDGDEIVGVVTLVSAAATRGSPLYDRPGVAKFGQFAVRPSHQRLGIGSALLSLIERRAAEQGVSALALDTSEHAAHLIAFYESRGYRFVEYCQWDDTNYRSRVFAKPVHTRSESDV